MAKPIFGYRNFVDLAASSLSGGSWRSTLPLANIQDRLQSKVARSTTDSTANAQFQVDLGASRLVRAAGLFGHNLSLSGTIRLRGYTGTPPSGEVYDSGVLNPFVIYPSGVLEAGHPAFGGTTLVAEDFDEGYPVPWMVAFTAVSARHWLFEIDDTSNPDGFIDIGRAWLTYGYQPSHGVSVGQRHSWSTSSRRRETDGGAAFYNERPRRRVIDTRLRMFEEDESLVYLQELNRYLGTSKQMMYIANPDAVEHMHRESGLFTLKELRALAFSQPLLNDQGFTMIEDL